MADDGTWTYKLGAPPKLSVGDFYVDRDSGAIVRVNELGDLYAECSIVRGTINFLGVGDPIDFYYTSIQRMTRVQDPALITQLTLESFDEAV